MRHWLVGLVAAAMVLSGCEAIGSPGLAAEEAAWCTDNDLPSVDGGLSVASVAREMKLASPEMERALAAMEAAMPAGAAIMEKQVAALAAGDNAAYTRLNAEYQTWQTTTMAPLRADLAAALVAWRKTPGYIDACRTAYQRRGTAASTTAPSVAPSTSAEPTAEPIDTTTTTGPKLVANDTIRYTSSTSVGRTIELKVTVRNKGKIAGKITMEVEGLNFAIKRKTPLVGCVPNCKAATGAEGVAYIVWTAPAAGKSRIYVAQLKAKASGTFKYEVRLYIGKVGNYGDELGTWTVTTRVR
jgi:hypothetical protein